MNTRKPLAVFRSTLPDDSVENSHGDIVVPAGRNILERICGSLNSQGYVIAGIEQYCFYGWETSFEIEGIKIWMLLQCPGPWILMTKVRAGFLTRLRWGPVNLRTGLACINQSLSNDSTVMNLRWLSEDELENEVRQ